MEVARANIPVMWIWAPRTTTAQPPIVTNHHNPNNRINNNNHNNHQQIMPNINHAQSSKSPNSDIANSPSDNMKSQIINYIRAGYPGLYLVSHEEQRVALEMTRIAQ